MEEISEVKPFNCTEKQTQQLDSMNIELDSEVSDQVNVAQQKENDVMMSAGCTNQDEPDSDEFSNDDENSEIPQHSNKKSDGLHEEKEKIILDEISRNDFDVLPDGWIEVTHISGMPMYLCQEDRVCTLSKPFGLGSAKVQEHEIPLSAVPCLQYKRALKAAEEEKQKESDQPQDAQAHKLTLAKIKTIQEHKATHSVNSESLKKYCQSLFRFKTMKVPSKKQQEHLEKLNLPDGTKLITFPERHFKVGESSGVAKAWTLNPSNKSYPEILHEMLQNCFSYKMQAEYKFFEVENFTAPVIAKVYIEDMEHGIGHGESKELAKAEAARKALEILIKDRTSEDAAAIYDLLNSSQATGASKDKQEKEVTSLQEKAIDNQQYKPILEKLKMEMRKLKDETPAVKSIGIFKPPDLPPGSSANLDNVDL